MEAKVKAQTSPNKDVQKEIADLGEVGGFPLLRAYSVLDPRPGDQTHTVPKPSSLGSQCSGPLD